MFHDDPYCQLTRNVLEVIPVERIYLLGTTEAQYKTKTIFLTEASTKNSIEHMYLLVLLEISKSDRKNDIQDKIEKHCQSLVTVTVIVLDIEQFNSWLVDGNVFAYTVATSALLIYQNGSRELADPLIIDKEIIRKNNEVCYTQGLNKVQEFLAGADLFRIRNQNKMAAFMLHQAAEHALLTILKIGTGFHSCTHNIDRLIRYASLVSYQLSAVFPRKTENEKRLFSLLQKAYIDSRYREDYNIHLTDQIVLAERIRQIIGILDKFAFFKAEH
jgi:HEPN domain-containing protein